MSFGDGKGSTSAGEQRIAELEEQVLQLSASLRAQEAFIAAVAHELRNPMTPILGNVQRLRRLTATHAALPDEFRASLGRLEWLIERYIRRATILLDVSRINAGKHILSPEPLDFVQVLRAVIEANRPVAQHVRSSITLRAPVRVEGICDPLAFEQIAENLVTNALKYGAGKPVEVSLSENESTIELVVGDLGPGISALDQSRIFERFERLVGDPQGAGGFGVGLWIVRQLVEALGGAIRVDSELGRGSSFIVVLPVDAGDRSTSGSTSR